MAETRSAAQPLLRTPLYDLHLQAGARMVDFAGWLMPIQYRSILAEHQAVRSSAGLFDLSHMGRLFVRGPQATELVQWVTVNDVTRLGEGQAHYTVLCNQQGGILDDAVVYRQGADYLLVVNASNRLKLVDWIQAQRAAQGYQAELDDATHRIAMLGLQGPHAQQVLQKTVEVDLDAIGYYWSQPARVAGAEAVVARTGYTGEDGFEVMLPAQASLALWRELVDTPRQLQPDACGLGARDTLRLEAGMALYGHEIDDSTHPYEAGMGWLVKLDKGDFAGREVLASLKHQSPARKLIGFRLLEEGIPRQGYSILVRDREVGRVTSGGFAPTLRASIGMAYVATDASEIGQELAVMVRGRPVLAQVVQVPFYPHRTRRRKKD